MLYAFAINPKERCLGEPKGTGTQRGGYKGFLLLQRVKRTLLLALIGGVCWLLDRLACEQLSQFRFGYVQLHAWWHVFTGLALHEVFVLTAALHMFRYRKVKTGGQDVDGPALCRPLEAPAHVEPACVKHQYNLLRRCFEASLYGVALMCIISVGDRSIRSPCI